MKKLNNFLLILLPAVLFFSYFPVLKIGETDAMNLEFSLPEIWLVVFFFANLSNLKNLIKTFGFKKLTLAAIFPLYASLSIFWSANRLRAILTAGLLWLIAFAIVNIIYHLKSVKADKLLKQKILQSFFISSVIVCIFCWLQCILDIAGLPRSETLLCAGCTYASFGFPHPNGFAIEPQFMGNLLLAPALLAWYFIISPHSVILKIKPWQLKLCATLFTATLFLTFSRGAIYAFAIAIVAFIIYSLRQNRKVLLTIPILCAIMIVTLCVQGIFSQLSPTSDTFYSGVTKAVHQLSLGKLDFRPAEPEAETNPESKDSKESEESKDSSFSGYVEESTNRRLDLTNYALDIWDDSKLNMLFGTGLGSAGRVMAEKYGFDSAKEIVQNQYASLLLELGLAGYAVLIFIFIKLKPKFNALIVAYLISLLFFAGLPNALHIYLLPPLLYAILRKALDTHSAHVKIKTNEG